MNWISFTFWDFGGNEFFLCDTSWRILKGTRVYLFLNSVGFDERIFGILDLVKNGKFDAVETCFFFNWACRAKLKLERHNKFVFMYIADWQSFLFLRFGNLQMNETRCSWKSFHLNSNAFILLEVDAFFLQRAPFSILGAVSKSRPRKDSKFYVKIYSPYFFREQVFLFSVY